MKKSGGRGSRQKGDQFERDCVNFLNERGISAARVPLSGAMGGIFAGDLRVMIQGSPRRVECKIRGRAWTDLYQWIEGNFALFIRSGGRRGLVVLRLEDLPGLFAEDW